MVKTVATRAVLLLFTVLISVLTAAPAQAQPPGTSDSDDTSALGVCDSLPDWAQNIPILPGVTGETGINIGNACNVGAAAADPGAAASAAVDWATSGAVGEAAEAFLEGFGQAVNLMFTWWLDIPLPDLANPESVGVFHSYFYWINASLVAVSIAVAAVRLAAANAAARADRATDTAKILVRTVFATATFAPLLIVTHAGAVKFGKWIVEDAAGGNVADVLGTMFDLSQVSSLLSAGLVMVFALLGIVGALVQAVFVVVQYAMLILVVGFLPTAAAGSGTPAGEQAFKKMIGFALATVLFPILSAGVYALALWSAGGDDAMSKLCGMALLALSCLSLPVLLRLIVPAVAASGGASGAGALAGAAVATGAVAGMAMKAGSAGAAAVAGGRSGGGVIGGQSPDRATGAMTNPPSTSAGQGGGGRSGSAGAAGAAGAASGAQPNSGVAGSKASSGATAAGAASATRAGATAVAAAMQSTEKATGAAAGDDDRNGQRGGRTP
jgi:type IV secretion system protein TrbL